MIQLKRCFFLASIVFLLIGCTKEEKPVQETINPIDSPTLPQRGFFMGILPTPANNQTLEDSYSQASQTAEFVVVRGRPTPFYEFADELAGEYGNYYVDSLLRGNDMFPIICVNFFDEDLKLQIPPDMDTATLSDLEWRDRFKNAVLNIVRASKPLYLSIGYEVNRWFERYGAEEGDPNGFQNFVNLYHEVYDSVKILSPETYVFCIFAREIVDENREADISVINMFDYQRMDLVVFTSKPYVLPDIQQTFDLPDDYYSRVFRYFPVKPFGLVDLGWPSTGGYTGEKRQADYLQDTATRLTRDRGLLLRLFGWVRLHDLDESDSLGILHFEGSEKEAYMTWLSLSQSGGRK